MSHGSNRNDVALKRGHTEIPRRSK